MNKYKQLFPMLKNKITYLDSGALVQKPKQVIDAINDFYTKYSISNRTSDSKLGIEIISKIDQTREKAANLINASKDEIIFNSGATEGLNYAAKIIEEMINKNDEIIIWQYNHSSHIVPWIELAKRKKAKLVFSKSIIDDVNQNTKVVAYTQMSNNFDISIDLKKLNKLSKQYDFIIVNDAAQAISHQKVDANYSDIIAFSSNKLFGPTGLGILYIDNKILSKIESKKYGGGTVDYIKENGQWKPKDSILKHEPGTLNLAAIFGFYEALNFFNSINLNDSKMYLKNLSSYAYDQLKQIDGIIIESKKGDSIILFRIKNISSQDIASYLGHKDIYVRSGIFCAQYLNHIIEDSLVRVSLHIYNDKKDIDTLINVLKKGGDFIDFI